MNTWQTLPVSELRPGDRVRLRGAEFEIGRIDHPFLGMDQMACLIEDTPTRWHAHPAGVAEQVEVLRAG
jgi:hypothetical protein